MRSATIQIIPLASYIETRSQGGINKNSKGGTVAAVVCPTFPSATVGWFLRIDAYVEDQSCAAAGTTAGRAGYSSKHECVGMAFKA